MECGQGSNDEGVMRGRASASAKAADLMEGVVGSSQKMTPGGVGGLVGAEEAGRRRGGWERTD